MEVKLPSTELSDLVEPRPTLRQAKGVSDDVIVGLNVSKVIEYLISIEDAERKRAREKADLAFIEQLSKETFGDA